MWPESIRCSDAPPIRKGPEPLHATPCNKMQHFWHFARMLHDSTPAGGRRSCDAAKGEKRPTSREAKLGIGNARGARYMRAARCLHAIGRFQCPEYERFTFMARARRATLARHQRRATIVKRLFIFTCALRLFRSTAFLVATKKSRSPRSRTHYHLLCTPETSCTSHAPKCTKTHHFFDFFPPPRRNDRLLHSARRRPRRLFGAFQQPKVTRRVNHVHTLSLSNGLSEAH